MTMLLLQSVSFSVIVDYWTNTVSRTVLATPGSIYFWVILNFFLTQYLHTGVTIYYHTMHLKEFGGFIQCYISVYHIFSSSAEDNASVDPLDVIGQVWLSVKGIFTEATRKMPFPPNTSLT